MSEIMTKNNPLPQAEAKLRDIQNRSNYFINKLENLKDILSFNDRNIIDHIIIVTKRLEEESTRGLYFVTIQGSLKTGKSTLTNLLIKRDIAITKAGQDTTKTPYIITKSTDNESKIIVYYRTKNIQKEKNDETFKQILEAIMDDIKGLNFENPYKKYFNKKVEPLDKKRIEKYTVEENLEEALFINIQIANNDKNNWMLAHDIAILDTPGIEGLKAAVNKQIIEEVKKRTNMLIVMQSTVTPVNSHELKELKDYQNEEAEIRLLHNKFELKPWADDYDEKKLKEEENKAIKKAKEIIQHELGKLPISNFFNLAKVYDYMKKPDVYEKLEKEYKEFEEFNKDLIQTINKIKLESKQRKAYTQFKNLLIKLQKENSPLNELKIKYQSNIDEIEESENKINTKFEEFRKNMESFVEIFYSNYKDKIENYISEKLSINNKLKITISNIGATDFFNKKEINQAVKEIQEFINILNKDINVSVKDKVIKYIKETKKDLVDVHINDLKKFLKENKLGSFVLKIPDIYFQENIIPDIVNIELNDNDVESLIKTNTKESKGIIFKDRIIEVEKLERHIKDSIFKSEISNKKREFFEKLKSIFSNKIIEYLKDIERIKNEILNEYEQITLSRKIQSQQVVKEIETLLRQIEETELKL